MESNGMPNNKSKYFLSVIITLGLITCSLAIYYLPLAKVDFGLLFLAVLIILFASRLSIPVPGSKVHFLMGDALIFLTFLLYGGESAIILAGAEASFMSLRLKKHGVFKKFSTVLQNAGIMACSTACTYGAVIVYNYTEQKALDYNNLTDFFSLLGLIALAQFVANSFIVALGATFKTGAEFWKTFREQCLGSSMIYIAGAACAGVAYKLIESTSRFAVVIAVFVVGLLYLTYRHYIAEIKLRREQAEQSERERLEADKQRVRDAERHVGELLESRQMLQLVLDTIPQYVFWKDKNLVYMGCNLNFAAAAGFSSQIEIVGRTDYDLAWGREESDSFRDSDRRIIESGKPEHLVRSRLHLTGGKEAWIDTSRVPLRNARGEIIGILGTFDDVTYRVQIEEEQENLKDQLLQSQKMEAVGTLAGGIAHDFNNLLMVILGNSQLAFRKIQSSDPTFARLGEIEKAAKRAAVLTRQLLTFSRRHKMERRTVNLNAAITEIIKLLDRIIGADVEVKIKGSPDLSDISADPAQIEQVIMNMAVNARDAMPDGGRLCIETDNITLDENYRSLYPYARPGKYVRINVSDTGGGMSRETQARIFEPFFTTKEVGKGTGLGLSTVYGIVKQHDGFINVYSELGHGTTFKIFLPVTESADESEIPLVESVSAGGTETILLAEDEEALRDVTRDMLEGLGYTVLAAKNGEEAVQVYEKNRERIDLLLLDVMMPVMNGTQAYERICRSGGDIPLIFMTGYSFEIVQSQFVRQNRLIEESGAMIIQKPYTSEDLAKITRQILARRKHTPVKSAG